MTRNEAKEAGKATYFTAVPCRRGHVAERRTNSGTCVICHRMASHKQWLKLKDGPPEILAWHYARQKAYVKGERPPPRPAGR